LDEANNVIAESEPLTNSVTDAEIQWLDDRMDEVNDCRLQFAFHHATVYSFLK